MNEAFRRFSNKTSEIVGSSWSFIVAVLVILVWFFTGPMFEYSDTWQLIINTGTTIVTFLMVFLIRTRKTATPKRFTSSSMNCCAQLKGRALAWSIWKISPTKSYSNCRNNSNAAEQQCDPEDNILDQSKKNLKSVRKNVAQSCSPQTTPLARLDVSLNPESIYRTGLGLAD
jgi:hypothetical protein